MKLTHTIQVAFALNVRTLDNRDQPVSALIMPVVLWSLFIPAWLYQAVGNIWTGYAGPLYAGLFVGWREDLAIIAEAARLLFAERRLAT